ncbi:hypothetical protein [Methylotenera sp.]|uniref:hypothetical protein n=1 Tax=Methylotenera sp. TaxID=2051956 RepID=UPI002488225F|nr:hypothetical protein [Methylotenera sp.]MDI1361843.1 hypothetical protein [Methylotenera sp.]
MFLKTLHWIPAFAGMTAVVCISCPLRHAEQRRHKGAFSKRLFEPSEFIGEFPIAAFMLSSVGEPLGRGAFFLGSYKESD